MILYNTQKLFLGHSVKDDPRVNRAPYKADCRDPDLFGRGLPCAVLIVYRPREAEDREDDPRVKTNVFPDKIFFHFVPQPVPSHVSKHQPGRPHFVNDFRRHLRRTVDVMGAFRIDSCMDDRNLSEEEKEKILGGNAQKLLQLHGPML